MRRLCSLLGWCGTLSGENAREATRKRRDKQSRRLAMALLEFLFQSTHVVVAPALVFIAVFLDSISPSMRLLQNLFCRNVLMLARRPAPQQNTAYLHWRLQGSGRAHVQAQLLSAQLATSTHLRLFSDLSSSRVDWY